MDRYIGLDVHLQSCTAVVLDAKGKHLFSQVVETHGEALVRLIRSVPGRKHLCLEECTQSNWLHELLSPHVHELVVVQPGKSQGCKSDARDASLLAEMLRTDTLPRRVYKAPKAFAQLRSAVRAYTVLTQDAVRMKNRLRALLRSRGVTVTRQELDDTTMREQALAKLPAGELRHAQLLGQALDGISEPRHEALQWLTAQGRACPEVCRLTVVPGLGPRRAALIVAIVMTPHRFRTRQQFWSYCGLAVVTKSSADWTRKDGDWQRTRIAQTRGLNRNRHPLLKAAFKGAAKTVATRMSQHPLARDYARQLAGGTKPHLARLTLARRIAALTLALWKHKEDYDPSRHPEHPIPT